MIAVAECGFRAFDDFGLIVPGFTAEKVSAASGVESYVGRKWRKHEFAVPLETNADGYHWREFTGRADKTIRILVLGDSFVEARQVPIGASFVALAEERLHGVQLLSMGRGGYYLPLQYLVFRDNVPSLFGPEGKYPPVHGVVFCLRRHGVVRIAHGRHDYELPKPTQPWQYRVKKGPSTWLRRQRGTFVNSRSHAASFFAEKAGTWLRRDLERTGVPVDTGRLGRAAELMRDAVVAPLLRLCESRRVPCAFLYLPTVEETSPSATQDTKSSEERILKILRAAEASHSSAVDALRDVEGAFFPADKHPTRVGHQHISGVLVDLIERDVLPRIEESE